MFSSLYPAQRQRALTPPVSEDGMSDDDGARREARKLVLVRVAGYAGAKLLTPFFDWPPAAAASIATVLARRAS